ncbi:MAG: hypothetical protein JRI93_01720, partial [Deltaproteobacteria bacterium]|nr:hypothetical protein [Deltaproteobacteria bacterium]
MKIIHRLAVVMVLLIFCTSGSAAAGQGDIYILRVADAIGPGIADFVAKG